MICNLYSPPFLEVEWSIPMNPFPDDADGSVLSDLASQGVDMTKPLQFEFFVVAPDEDTSKLIGDAVTQAGYEASVEYEECEPDENGEFDPDDEEFGPAWTVYAYVTMVPNYEEVIRIQDELDKIADRSVVFPMAGESSSILIQT